MATVDLRKLKDQATRAVEKKQYAKAAELYLQIADAEPGDADWRQRAGEAWRKAGQPAQAVAALVAAAGVYAHNGFLLKAIAVCKVVLQLDPGHTATQARLAELYARRDRRTLTVPMPPPEPPRPATPPPPAMPIVMSDNAEAALGLVAGAPLVDLDQRPAAAAPLDALPLREVLGGKRSEQFSVAALRAAAAEPTAYEITLDDDESDFSDVLAAPAPAPALPTIPLLSSLGADELRTVIERVAVRDFDAREVIMRQGAAGGSLFVVVSGRVHVLCEAPAPRQLASLGEGAFFGELGLLTNFPRSATVVAAEPTQLLEISRELVGEIVGRSPEVLRTLLRFFRDRLLDRLLGASPLFSSFAPDEARALAERFVFLELEPGLRVIAEGERAPGLFLLLCGEAGVTRGGGELARLGPGDVFGEMSLLSHGAATASIETRTQCWALELPRERFQEMMLTYPQMLDYVSQLADRRAQQNLGGSEARVDFL